MAGQDHLHVHAVAYLEEHNCSLHYHQQIRECIVSAILQWQWHSHSHVRVCVGILFTLLEWLERDKEEEEDLTFFYFQSINQSINIIFINNNYQGSRSSYSNTYCYIHSLCGILSFVLHSCSVDTMQTSREY